MSYLIDNSVYRSIHIQRILTPRVKRVAPIYFILANLISNPCVGFSYTAISTTTPRTTTTPHYFGRHPNLIPTHRLSFSSSRQRTLFTSSYYNTMTARHVTTSTKDSQTSSSLSLYEETQNQMTKDGKKPLPPTPLPVFAIASLIVAPLWFVTVVPMSLVYQSTKKLTAASSSSKAALPREAIDRTGSLTRPEDVIPLKERRYDVVLFGATGFVGKLAVTYLAKTYGVNKKVSWAIAGRSKNKLEQIKRDVAAEINNDDVLSLDIIVVDTSQPSTLPPLTSQTRTVISSVGPFAIYGTPVVESCTLYGTNYVDITGEIDWVRSMIAKYDAAAQRTGAKIVSLCGHDSIPWDLTVMELERALPEGEGLREVRCVNEYKAGGVSGGTVASALNIMDGGFDAGRFEYDPIVKGLGDTGKSQGRTKFVHPSYPMRAVTMVMRSSPRVSPGTWVMPSIMAGVNGEVVRRSHALRTSSSSSSGSLTYGEAQIQPDFKSAFVPFFALLVFFSSLLNPITGGLLRRFVIPKPGEGPTEESMASGYLCVYGYGIGEKGTKVESVFYFPADAGYKDTARMMVESGLCLALDSDKLPQKGGGCFTPSVGMGDALLQRLCQTGSLFKARVVD